MLLNMAKAGDTIITLEVSRLSRSTHQLCEIINIIKECLEKKKLFGFNSVLRCAYSQNRIISKLHSIYDCLFLFLNSI